MSTGACSGRVTRRTPPPTSTHGQAPPGCLARRAQRVDRGARVVRGEISRTSAMRSIGSGASEAKRSASSWPTRSGVTRLRAARPAPQASRGPSPGRPLDDDVAEQLPLLRPRALEPDQLEHGEERHDHLGPRRARRRAGSRTARTRTARARRRSSPCARGAAAPPARPPRVGSASAEPAQERPVGLGEIPERQALDRQVLGHRQLAPGPREARAPLGLALAEPGAELLDPRVRAEPRLQLLPEQLAVLVQGSPPRSRPAGRSSLDFR